MQGGGRGEAKEWGGGGTQTLFRQAYGWGARGGGWDSDITRRGRRERERVNV